jgi:hypothetical protein
VSLAICAPTDRKPKLLCSCPSITSESFVRVVLRFADT